MNTIGLIKYIDHLIGPSLLKLLPSSPKQISMPDPIKNILIIRPGGIGDASLLIPSLKAIWNILSCPKIDILCENRNSQIFKAVSCVNKVFSYKKPLHMIKVLSTEYDAVIDTEQSHFLSAVITRLARTDYRSGFKTFGREKMYAVSTPYAHTTYEAEQFWQLFNESFKLDMPFSWQRPCFTETRLPDEALNISPPFVCLFCGATVKERLWPTNQWARVADNLYENGFQVVLLGARNETAQVDAIQKACRKAACINLCEKLSLTQTAALLQSASLLISTDSGILHIGVVCGIPTLSLFGSGIEEKWAPKGLSHQVINLRLDCSPCTKFGTTPPCLNQYACMTGITAQDVVDAANL